MPEAGNGSQCVKMKIKNLCSHLEDEVRHSRRDFFFPSFKLTVVEYMLQCNMLRGISNV